MPLNSYRKLLPNNEKQNITILDEFFYNCTKKILHKACLQ